MCLEIGTYLLYAALFSSLLDLIWNLRKDGRRERYGPYLTLLTTGLLTATVVLLAYYFVADNFSIFYVWSYSSRDLGLGYKLSALWAGQAGSLLLWVFLFYWLYTAFRFSSARKEPVSKRMFLTASTTGVFLMVLTVMGGPFDPTHSSYLKAYPEGWGLNPALRNFWMLIHPPLVFMGYAAAAIPFAIIIARKSVQKGGEVLDGFEKLYMEICWLFLSLGIVIGGIWAYEALGWGGYWVWDPVETASLVPWLTCTAYFHARPIRAAIGRGKELAAVATFILVLFATFVTRGGVILSPLHGYAVAPTAAGWVLIAFMVGATSLSLFILYRSPTISPGSKRETHSRGREGWERYLTSKNVHLVLYYVLMILFIICFIGILRGASPEYYNASCFPFVAAFILGTMICTLLTYVDARRVRSILIVALAAGVFFAVILPITGNAYADFGIPIVTVSLVMVLYVIFKDLTSRGKALARIIKGSRRIIHFGILVTLLGVLLSSTMHGGSYTVSLTPGEGWPYPELLPGNIQVTIEKAEIRNQIGWIVENWTVGPHDYTWRSPEFYEADMIIQVLQDGKPIGTGALTCMYDPKWGPQLGWFSTVLIQRTLTLDVYIVAERFGLNFTDPQNVHSVWLQVSFHGFVNWVWIGSILLVFSILPSIWLSVRSLKGKRMRKASLGT